MVLNRRSEADRREYVIKPQGEITPLKSQLLGFLAGDGCIADRRGRAINTDPVLLKWTQQAIQEIYGVIPCDTTQWKNRNLPLTDIFLCKAITLDLHSLATWGIHTWSVPQAVFDGSDKVRAMYVRGFFDAEGGVFASVGIGSPGKHHNNVAAVSANKQGLLGISRLLDSLGIENGFYPTPIKYKGEVRIYHKVQIHKREFVIRFADVVGLESPHKLQTLERIRSFPPVLKKGDIFERRLAAIRGLGLENEVAPRVSEALGCSVKQVWDARRWDRRKPQEA